MKSNVKRDSHLFTGVMIHALVVMKRQAAMWLNYSSLVSSTWLFHGSKESSKIYFLYTYWKKSVHKWTHCTWSLFHSNILLFLHEHCLQQLCLLQTAVSPGSESWHLWDRHITGSGHSGCLGSLLPSWQHRCPDHASTFLTFTMEIGAVVFRAHRAEGNRIPLWRCKEGGIIRKPPTGHCPGFQELKINSARLTGQGLLSQNRRSLTLGP